MSKKQRAPSRFADGQTVELKGILSEVSSRSWAGGWSHGTLRTIEDGEIKITGILEGQVRGSCLLVRGTYIEDAKWGPQIKCSSILVDSVSNDVYVITAWAEQTFKPSDDDENLPEGVTVAALVAGIATICEDYEDEERWATLCSEVQLRVYFESRVAALVSKRANSYIKGIEAKRDLMNLGFTAREAEKIYKFYGLTSVPDWRREPYEVVISDVLGFARADAVVDALEDLDVSPTDVKRLIAAMLQALRSAARNGHTALPEHAMIKEAADIAGVYPEAVQRAIPHLVIVGALTIQKPDLAKFEDMFQLPDTARNEDVIARWVVAAARETAEGS